MEHNLKIRMTPCDQSPCWTSCDCGLQTYDRTSLRQAAFQEPCRIILASKVPFDDYVFYVSSMEASRGCSVFSESISEPSKAPEPES